MQNEEKTLADEGYSEDEEHSAEEAVAWQRHPAIEYAHTIPELRPALQKLADAWEKCFNRHLKRGRWSFKNVPYQTRHGMLILRLLLGISETLLQAECKILEWVLYGAVLKYRANIHCRALLDSWRA